MNLGKRFSAVLLAAAVALGAGCGSTATQESTGEFFDDSTITTKVKSAIFAEPSLKVAQISVETYKSSVQLSGFVSSQSEVRTAGAIARSVRGVASVQNDLLVK
jgi:osmotically-inducible protein OsmY